MPAILPEFIARLTFQQTITGNRVSSVMHYACDSSIVNRELDDLCNQWETDVLPAWMDAVSQELKAEAILAHCVDPNTCIPGTNYLSGITGTIAQEALPSNLSGIIQMRQLEVSGRHNGRVNVCGIPETMTLDGLLTAGYATTEMRALADALEGTLGVGGNVWTPCIFQREPSGPLFPGIGWAVQNARCTRNMATQRRRTTELREFHP